MAISLSFIGWSSHAGMCRSFLYHDVTAISSNLGPVIPWTSLIPGQTHVGKLILESYDFKRPIKFHEFEKEVVLNKNIPVIEIQGFANSRYVMLDGHHTVLRFLKMFQETQKELLIPIEVTETITTRNLPDHLIMKDLVDRGLIWSGKPIKKTWKFNKDWPSNILELKDMPIRSLVQLIFYDLDLSGKSFQPYIQFNLAEKIAAKGFQFAKKDLKTKKKQDRVKKQLLEFIYKNPDVLDLLKSNVVHGDTKGATQKLEAYKLK